MPRPNTGSLRANKNKTSDKHPNAKGSANIDGKEWWVSAWTNTDKQTGEKYQSLKFEPKEQQGQQSRTASQSRPSANDATPDDDIPY